MRKDLTTNFEAASEGNRFASRAPLTVRIMLTLRTEKVKPRLIHMAKSARLPTGTGCAPRKSAACGGIRLTSTVADCTSAEQRAGLITSIR
jgi:hypothetical protein